MPIIFEIDVARALVVTTVNGAVGEAEFLAHQARLLADERFSPSFDTMIEFRPGSAFNGSGEDIRNLAQSNPFGRESRRAYVVASDLNFGLARMAQEYGDMIGQEVELFRDRDAAFDWLDRGRRKR